MVEATLSLSEPGMVLSLFGARDQHLRLLREHLGVSITHREGHLRVTGEERNVGLATQALERLKMLLERRGELTLDDVLKILAQVTGNDSLLPLPQIDVINTARRMVPRTPGQAKYVQAIRENELVFGVGPAGSGKTYLAVAMAVEALKQKRVRKIVLVRPAVEAGESLGFLPGDLQAKINPYLRPLLDALNDMIDHDQIKRFMEMDVVEVIPLAYMRGRTLNEAFIILDEAQNATIAQMKMFLTRMGEGSKIVVAGDITQVDLAANTRSGMIDALTRLRDVRGVKIVEMTKADIVRHRLVQDIVLAYDDTERERLDKNKEKDAPEAGASAALPRGDSSHKDGRRKSR